MEPVHQPLKTKENCDYIIKNGDTINLVFLRRLINLTSIKNDESRREEAKKCQTSLLDIFKLLITSREIGNETISLAAHGFLSLQRASCTSENFQTNLKSYLTLNVNKIVFSNKVHDVADVELFKLRMSNGYLQLSDRANYSDEMYKLIFNVLYSQCIRYTRYTYLAFKILQTWVEKVGETDLWRVNCIELESKLEAIIFSNWDNTICKGNVSNVFAAYLQVMKSKYTDYLTYLFYSCVHDISWCHPSKYAILAEICDSMENIELITESKFISNLFNSLTITRLHNISSKLYRSISNKLSPDLWKATFGDQLKNYVITWESEKKYYALETLCKNWIEPTIKNHRELLIFLSECCDESSILYQSHLQRIAKKFGSNVKFKFDDVNLLESEEESVRSNIFAAHCYEVGNLDNDRYDTLVTSIKHFLFLNATAETSYLRGSIVRYFIIFLSNILKRAFTSKEFEGIVSFLEWLYEFQVDCFEIGSCYQRKIFGLVLYKITLQFTCSDVSAYSIISKDPNYKEAIKYGPLLRNVMKGNGTWKFTDKQMLILLFKLVLDPAVDIMEYSTSIIIQFFDPSLLTHKERIGLFQTALGQCNSCKFFESDSGACLFKILAKWYSLNEVKEEELISIGRPAYATFLFDEGKRQLAAVKKDILKAATQNSPFYGVIAALIPICFNDGPESHLIDEACLIAFTNLLDEAVDAFLSAFAFESTSLESSSSSTSSSSSSTSATSATSSSFKDMSLAISEAIKSSELNYDLDQLVLSPAEQSLIACIWRSLKALCELAVEICKSHCATETNICKASGVIVKIIVKCRHKGVIESAGLAIGNITRYLCKIEKCTDVLEGYLTNLMNSDLPSGRDLTRRGAGLTIMFHKIVANDLRSDRPLLHLAVDSLIESLSSGCSPIETERSDETGLRDDPRAIQLHFLKSLVTDKQLQPQLAPYIERICLICFEFMPSRSFTIRNASLQLFGAIVSRLVGQNTGGRSVDFGYGYSINYFATHFPRLAAHALLSLQASYQPDDEEKPLIKLQSGTNVIHILSLMSKMYFSGCELVDGTSATYVKQIHTCLHLLLKSPIAHVRNLAAKCLAATTGLPSIEQEIRRLKGRIGASSDFNLVNGQLYALEHLYDKRDDEIESTTIKHAKVKSLSEVRRNLESRSKSQALWNFWSRRSALIEEKELCYAIEAQLIKLSRACRLKVIQDRPGEPSSRERWDPAALPLPTKPGFFELVEELMRLFADYTSYNEDSATINLVLEAKCLDFGIHFLRSAPNQNRSLLIRAIECALNNFEVSRQFMLEETNWYANESIRHIFRGKILRLQCADVAKITEFATRLEKAFPTTPRLTELLMLVRLLHFRGSAGTDLFREVSSCISTDKLELLDYFGYPEVIRQLIAKTLETSLCYFEHLDGSNRFALLLATLLILKDEMYLVRDALRESVLDNLVLAYGLSKRKVTTETIYYILLVNLVSERSLLGDLSEKLIVQFFRLYLSTIQRDCASLAIEHLYDDNNITPYKEETKFINLVVFCVQQKTIKSDITKGFGEYQNISFNIFNTKNNLIKNMDFHANDLQCVLNLKYDKYINCKLQVANELYLKKE